MILVNNLFIIYTHIFLLIKVLIILFKERNFKIKSFNSKNCCIFAKKLRSQAAPQQLKFISLRSVCTDIAPSFNTD